MNEPYDIIKTVRLTEKATLLAREAQPVRLPRSLRTRTSRRSSRRSRSSSRRRSSRVNTCNYAGKKKRERTAAYGRTPDWKKAIVTLKDGDKIELA